MLRDATDALEVEERLAHAAGHDHLTGLPNRRLVTERLALVLGGEGAAGQVVVLFCDLDGFKRVNDTQGHHAGDAVLVEIAGRMTQAMRIGDTVARMGGDEFVVICEVSPGLDPDDLAETVARRLVEAVSEPIVVDGAEHRITVSVGIYVAGRGDDADAVLRNADGAMYLAKIRGKNGHATFETALHADAVDRRGIERMIRGAIAAGSIEVHYQPVVHPGTGRVLVVEALLRVPDASAPEPGGLRKYRKPKAGSTMVSGGGADCRYGVVAKRVGDAPLESSPAIELLANDLLACRAEIRMLSVALAAANASLQDAARVADANDSRYGALVDHLPDTVAYIWDRQRRITVARGSGVSGRGFDSDQLVGMTPEEGMTPADAALVRGYLDAAFEGRAVSAEAYFETTGLENLIDAVPLTGASGLIDEVLLVARDITRLKDRERALSDAEVRWRAAFEDAPVGMAELGLEGRVLRANRKLAEILGRAEESLTGQVFFDFLHPDEREDARGLAATVTTGTPTNANRSLLTPAGQQRWVALLATRLTGTGSAPDRLLVHVVDVSDQHQQQARLAALSGRFSALIEHSSDSITISGMDGGLLYASPAFAHLAGTESAGWDGQDIRDLIHPDDRALVERSLGTLRTDGDVTTFECRIRHATAGWRQIEVTASNWLGDEAVQGIVSNARDVTERVEAAAHLAHRAMHDLLTDLPNRALLLDRLDQALARATRSGRPSAVLFIDLDRFKQINDSLGHAAGDQVLITVAARLLEMVRPADSVARLGGDEFVVLAEDIDDPSVAEEIAERIRSGVAEPITLAERAVSIGCSIGIAISDRHSPETLLQEADMALYQAKGAGRNRWELYDQAMRTQAQRRLETEQLVRNAITGDQLEVHYQPVVDLRTGLIAGTEALARIRGPEGRLVGPNEFIAVAEDCGLIVPLGAAVLRQACEQQARWRTERTGLHQMAVNVSARQLADNDFANRVLAVLAETGLPAGMLCLELTETALIDAGTSSRNQIAAIKALGVTLALDDFGTGWSSLAYLRRFPFDIVKIDQSFVAGLGANGDDTEVVKAVIGLGQALGLRTVAEGVETEQQAALLRELGCDQAQGYLYGRPEPADLVPVDANRSSRLSHGWLGLA